MMSNNIADWPRTMAAQKGHTRRTRLPLVAAANAISAISNSDDRGRSGYLRSRVQKRSIVVGKHKTSVSLEDVFWNELRSIAQGLGLHLSELVARIDLERRHGNLSSAIRLFVFEQRCKPSADEALKDAADEATASRRHD